MQPTLNSTILPIVRGRVWPCPTQATFMLVVFPALIHHAIHQYHKMPIHASHLYYQWRSPLLPLPIVERTKSCPFTGVGNLSIRRGRLLTPCVLRVEMLSCFRSGSSRRSCSCSSVHLGPTRPLPLLRFHALDHGDRFVDHLRYCFPSLTTFLLTCSPKSLHPGLL